MADIVRRLEEVVRARLRSAPALVLHGPRTVGKSTLLRRVAARYDHPVADLDALAVRQAASDAPAFFVQGEAPVFIDEFQHVPELLDAIKAELNVELTPGRFVLAGSTSYLTLPRAAQSLTGRVEVLTVWPLSQGELGGVHETFSSCSAMYSISGASASARRCRCCFGNWSRRPASY
ncbi:MAG: ATP-binding protein [Pseudonocardiaceae bacterium]